MQLGKDTLEFDKSCFDSMVAVGLFQPNQRICYGTSGFRFNGSALDFIAFRTGLFIGELARLKAPLAVGVVVTASHNPPQDNGVKVIDEHGHILSKEFEALLEDFVNESDLAKGLQCLVSRLQQSAGQGAQQAEGLGVVFVGHDNRDSSARLTGRTRRGVAATGQTLVELGLAATPLVYFAVFHFNRTLAREGRRATAEELRARYFDGFGSAFADLRRTLGVPGPKARVVVDSANGVGFLSVRRFFEQHLHPFYDMLFINNDDPLKINDGCGAEFVQKDKALPANCPANTDVQGIALDGDADRLVFFQSANGRFDVMDGDKQSALLALGVRRLMGQCFPKVSHSFGIVLTQYANFGLIDFLNAQGLSFVMVPTGVKHSHQKADQFDVCVLFESNGHGLLKVSDSLLDRVQQAYPAEAGGLPFKLLSFKNDVGSLGLVRRRLQLPAG